jgi:hypothetical protein
MKKFIFTLMFLMLPFSTMADELKSDFIGGLGFHLNASWNGFIYKVCIDNYEYVAIRLGESRGGVSIVQSYERVVDNEGRVIALPKMCSLNDGITNDE